VRAASNGSARVVICEPSSDTVNAAQNLAKSRGNGFLAIVLSLPAISSIPVRLVPSGCYQQTLNGW
jgi:hypothetical protein